MSSPTDRLTVLKTSKLYIGGKFVRSESGRTLQALTAEGSHWANYGYASRKDLREAVVAARRAQPGWQGYSPYLRGQILYRMAEMLEDRASAFANGLIQSGADPTAASSEVHTSVDRLVHFAGWSDKVEAVFGSVNPVSTPYFNFTALEPMGVVGILCPREPALAAAVTLLAAAIVSGNTVVLLASESAPLPMADFAEVAATSDVPAGVLNILTGKPLELLEALATHYDVNAIVAAGVSDESRTVLGQHAATNLKRLSFPALTGDDWLGEAADDPYQLLETVERKTVWHPVGV